MNSLSLRAAFIAAGFSAVTAGCGLMVAETPFPEKVLPIIATVLAAANTAGFGVLAHKWSESLFRN